jgi:predicted  nucleic acid-binding Zn-ribbon protein
MGLDRERSGIESELPASLVASIRRIEAGRQGLFMSKADDGVCQSCFVRIRPQGFQEVKLALKIHYCSNCKRLMFHEPSLQRMAAAQSGDEASPGSGTDQIEAVDGGAI